MQCPKHPSYKGIRKPKRDCPTCLELYKSIQKEANKYHKFISITTPGFKCGIEHLMAELSCIMLFGQQPPFFWRKNTIIPQKIKEQYKSILLYIQSLKSYDFDKYKALDNILYHVFILPYKRLLAKRQNTEIEQVKTEEQEIVVSDPFDFTETPAKQSCPMTYEMIPRSTNDQEKG